jgi:hypothetical protein
VLDVFFIALEAYSVGWKSFTTPKNKYVAIWIKKILKNIFNDKFKIFVIKKPGSGYGSKFRFKGTVYSEMDPAESRLVETSIY